MCNNVQHNSPNIFLQKCSFQCQFPCHRLGICYAYKYHQELEPIEIDPRQIYASKYPWMVVYYTRNEERVIKHSLCENKGQTTPTRDNPDASSHMQQRVYHTDPSDKQI